MNLELILMSENDIAEFKKNVQCAFQKGFEDVFGKCEETILPEKGGPSAPRSSRRKA